MCLNVNNLEHLDLKSLKKVTRFFFEWQFKQSGQNFSFIHSQCQSHEPCQWRENQEH